MELSKKPSVFQAKNDQSLGFHGLGQPGAASSQERPGEEPAAARRAGSQQPAVPGAARKRVRRRARSSQESHSQQPAVPGAARRRVRSSQESHSHQPPIPGAARRASSIQEQPAASQQQLLLDKVIESGFRSQGPTELSRILQSVRPFELRLFSAKKHTLDSLSGNSY